MANSVKVFIASASDDAKYLDYLYAHLSNLEKKKEIVFWDESRADPGARIADVITLELAKAQVVLCLFSARFLNSKYTELDFVEQIAPLHENSGMNVIPIILKACDWDGTEFFGALNPLPVNQEPVVRGGDSLGSDEAYLEIVDALEAIINGILEQRKVASDIRLGKILDRSNKAFKVKVRSPENASVSKETSLDPQDQDSFAAKDHSRFAELRGKISESWGNRKFDEVRQFTEELSHLSMGSADRKWLEGIQYSLDQGLVRDKAQFHSLYNQAVAHFNKENYSLAMSTLQDAEKLDPDDIGLKEIMKKCKVELD